MLPYQACFKRIATNVRVNALVASSMVLLASAVSLTICGQSDAVALDAKLQGTAYFKAKDYRHAAAAYKIAMGQNPNDAAIAYYYALSLQYCKDIKGAKLAYLDVLTKFPSTSSASYAQAALAAMDPSILGGAAPTRLQSFSGSSSGGSGSSNGDVIPASSIVNFDMENNHMVVDVAFNGRRTKAIFDTGAETILIGKNTLAQLGLPMPKGETVARSRGVGDKIEDVWGERMAVTVGGVTRNVMVHIQEKIDHLPLLGLPFVQGLNYAVESNCIRLSAKNSASSTASRGGYGSSSNGVPYVMRGRTMVVNAQVNGRTIPMCFDTGAAGTLFTKAQADAAGIRIPEGAEAMVGSGAGGSILGNYVSGVSIRLGNIDKRDMKVGIDLTGGSMPYPLLGRDFWGDQRYAFDEDNHVIKFN